MKFSAIMQLVKTQWLDGSPRDVFFVESAPGIGKSAMAHALGNDKELGFDNVIEINASLLDIPDVAGLALIGDTTSDVLKFKHSPLIYPAHTGRNLMIHEEVPDSPIAMQNLLARLVYDRELNGLKLSDQTYHILLGNRSKDKSGAGRVSTKLANRVCRLEMDPNLDDWVDNFAIPNNIDPVGIQFLRFKPGLFSDFNADAHMGINPTPRSWTRVFRTSPNLPTDLYFAKCKGEVGDGPAAEYTTFRKIYEGLISFEEVVMNPTTVKIPKDLSAQYAIVGSVSHNTNVQNIERVSKFIDRMSPEFGVMYWQDTIKRVPAIKTTKPFIQWATSAGNVVTN